MAPHPLWLGGSWAPPGRLFSAPWRAWRDQKQSFTSGWGRKHDFFHAQNDGNDHVLTDWAAVLLARFLSLFDCQTAADSCEGGIGTIYMYHRLRKIVSSILTQVWKILYFLHNAMFHGYYMAIMLL